MNSLIKLAISYFGEREGFGRENNKKIVSFFHELGYSYINDDKIPWCSAFASCVAKRSMYEYNKKINVRGWLNVGYEVSTPEMGDIVVFLINYIDSEEDYVGFFIRETENHVWVLGGDQNNSVSINPYPKCEFLKYRRLRNYCFL